MSERNEVPEVIRELHSSVAAELTGERVRYTKLADGDVWVEGRLSDVRESLSAAAESYAADLLQVLADVAVILPLVRGRDADGLSAGQEQARDRLLEHPLLCPEWDSESPGLDLP